MGIDDKEDMKGEDERGMVHGEDDKLQLRVVDGVRQLRLQLEQCIDSNDQLRQRLQDCARNHHSSRCSCCERQLTSQPGEFQSLQGGPEKVSPY